jgi:light-regulated signal transduction histidine kinase (bacteriophytochrome)
LANFVETLRSQTRLQSETEIEALGQQARDLAVSVESVRKETRLQFELEVTALGQKARDLAVSVETVREETLLHSDSEIAALGQQARDLAVSVESVREETLLQSDTEIETLMKSDKVTRTLNEELELRVLERTGQPEAANKELEAFSYSVSHDLRAPLRAIDGFSRIMLKEFTPTMTLEAREYLEDIRANTQKMGHLVDDLLTFSRLSRQPLKKEPMAPAKLVRQCLKELRGEQEGRRVEIHMEELPECSGDAALLKQVWTNLLANARKYTSKREVATIEVGSYRDKGTGERVYFVKDNGVGFDMVYAHKLFGVFQRLHRSEDYEGTGVGLAIVQRIVHRHGGRVWACSQLETGASFFFTLVSGDPVHD